MSRFATKVKKAGVECETQVGNLPERIVEAAKDTKTGMIIQGIQGLHGIARLRSLGSVARRVLESSAFPVTVVPLRES